MNSEAPIPDIARAVGLRIAGVPFTVIAEQCGFVTASAAQVAVRDALTAAAGFDPATEVITDLARLDRLLSGLWRDAASGDEGMARAALKIITQRAELLALAETVGVKEAGPTTALDELHKRRAARGASTDRMGRA